MEFFSQIRSRRVVGVSCRSDIVGQRTRHGTPDIWASASPAVPRVGPEIERPTESRSAGSADGAGRAIRRAARLRRSVSRGRPAARAGEKGAPQWSHNRVTRLLRPLIGPPSQPDCGKCARRAVRRSRSHGSTHQPITPRLLIAAGWSAGAGVGVTGPDAGAASMGGACHRRAAVRA